MRPVNLQKADLPKLTKVISFLASLYQQVLLVRDHSPVPGVDSTTTHVSHFTMLEALDSALLCLLRYLVARAFPEKPLLLDFLDERNRANFLSQSFFKALSCAIADYWQSVNRATSGASGHRWRPVQESTTHEGLDPVPLFHDFSDGMLPLLQLRLTQAVEANIAVGNHVTEQMQAADVLQQSTTQNVDPERRAVDNIRPPLAAKNPAQLQRTSKDGGGTLPSVLMASSRTFWWSSKATKTPRQPPAQDNDYPFGFRSPSRGSSRTSSDLRNDWDEAPLRHLTFNAESSD